MHLQGKEVFAPLLSGKIFFIDRLTLLLNIYTFIIEIQNCTIKLVCDELDDKENAAYGKCFPGNTSYRVKYLGLTSNYLTFDISFIIILLKVLK